MSQPVDWKGPGQFVGWNCSPPQIGSNYVWKKGELDKLNPKIYTSEQKIRDEISIKNDKTFVKALKDSGRLKK
jgi:hypothetical protein